MKMWCFVLCLFHVFIDISYGYGANCSPQDGYPCEMYSLTGNNCTPYNLNTIFPEDFYQTNSTEYPGQPGNISLTLEYKLFGASTVPQVVLSFTPPKDVGKNYVKGFEVSRNDIVNMVPSATKCYIYNLSTVTWNKASFNETKMIFTLTLFPVNPDTTHMQFDVYALPKYIQRGESDLYRSIAIEMPAYIENNNAIDAKDWIATVVCVKQELERSIVVHIYPPPTSFQLTQIEYSLIDNTTREVVATKILSVTENCTFSNVVSGTYRIWVKPISPPGSYITTETQPIIFNAATIPEQSSTVIQSTKAVTQPTTTATTILEQSSNETQPTTKVKTAINSSKEAQLNSNINVAWTIVGVLLGVCVVGGIFAFVCHHRWHNSKETPITGTDNPNYKGGVGTFSIISDPAINNKPDKLPLKNRPKLFLLYEEDHKYHRKVVEKFASYLQLYCHCDVMCVEWQLDAAWVHQDLQQADYAVIVNSEGASHTYFSHGNKNMHNFQQHSLSPTSKGLSSINSIKNKFMHEDRYDNIVMIYFEYTDEKFLLPDICPGFKYQIPKHLTDFLLHIHKLHRTDNLAQYDLPLDGNHNLEPIGQEFLNALAEVSQYQRANPDWAIQRFGLYRCWSSDDSQHDSGLPDEIKSPSSKKEINDNKFQMLMDYLDTTSLDAITINPSDIRFGLDGITVSPNGHAILLKQRPMLSAHSFNQINGVPCEVLCLQSPQSGDTDLYELNFIPPDDADDSDAISRSQSDQLKSLVDRYQVCCDLEAEKLDCGQQNQTAPVQGYNRDDDLLLLQVHSGEVPFIATDRVSLGGKSI